MSKAGMVSETAIVKLRNHHVKKWVSVVSSSEEEASFERVVTREALELIQLSRRGGWSRVVFIQIGVLRRRDGVTEFIGDIVSGVTRKRVLRPLNHGVEAYQGDYHTVEVRSD